VNIDFAAQEGSSPFRSRRSSYAQPDLNEYDTLIGKPYADARNLTLSFGRLVLEEHRRRAEEYGLEASGQWRP
jgi:hypothetical protein